VASEGRPEKPERSQRLAVSVLGHCVPQLVAEIDASGQRCLPLQMVPAEGWKGKSYKKKGGEESTV